VKLPDTPLLLAGALGGPFCIFILTPLRNALTLASQDTQSSVIGLYKATFSDGFASGWTGGMVPVVPSSPQFCVMGPVFYVLKGAFNSAVLAVLLCAVIETGITYGSQTLNAQLAFNQAGVGEPVPLLNPLMPFGPGCAAHIIRNILAMSGIRIFSGPCQAALSHLARACGVKNLPIGVQQFVGDFVASVGSAVLSAPLNQLYNFAVTSETYMNGNAADRMSESLNFLSESYLEHSPTGAVIGFTPTLGRDLVLRSAYVASLYSLYGLIERFAVAVGNKRSHRSS